MSSATRSKRQEIAELYRKYGGLVEHRCQFLLRDEEAAKDATQEVFVKVMRALDGFRGESSRSTWILKVATNHCLNVIAAKKAGWHERFRRYRRHAIEVESQKTGDPVEKSESVRRLLSLFDAETQQVAIHYFVDEMTQDEIAKVMDRSIPTVRKRLETFLRVAKKELAHELA